MATQQGSPDADTDKVATGERSIKLYFLRVVSCEQVFSAEGNKADETRLGLRS